MTTFDQFIKELREEAEAEGSDVVTINVSPLSTSIIATLPPKSLTSGT